MFRISIALVAILIICAFARIEGQTSGAEADDDLGKSLQSSQKGKPAAGPLRVHPTNPRYFTDGTKLADGSFKAVYLTGAHTWNNLVDMGRSDPPEKFDFDAHLDFLETHHHNFIRLWAFKSPFDGPAGLYLKARHPAQ